MSSMDMAPPGWERIGFEPVTRLNVGTKCFRRPKTILATAVSGTQRTCSPHRPNLLKYRSQRQVIQLSRRRRTSRATRDLRCLHLYANPANRRRRITCLATHLTSSPFAAPQGRIRQIQPSISQCLAEPKISPPLGSNSSVGCMVASLVVGCI